LDEGPFPETTSELRKQPNVRAFNASFASSQKMRSDGSIHLTFFADYQREIF
jgi:hypothetical protein